MRAERPFVSIIIPHLNQVEAAARCLRSVENQDWPDDNLEVIFVDNGSHRDLAKLKSDFPRVRFLEELRPGPGMARNAGVVAARGDVLAFIDADCRADPLWVKAAVRGVMETDGPVGGDVRIDFVDAADPTPLEAFEAVFAYRQRLYIERKGFSGTGNLAMKSRDFAMVGPFGGIEIAEDRDWGQRAKAAGLRLDYRPDMIVFHPARQAMDELRTKWRRHVAHDFASAGKSRVRCAINMAAVALSILPHGIHQLCSSRVAPFRGRLRGLSVLVQIRLWRIGEMVRQIRETESAARSWNRG